MKWPPLESLNLTKANFGSDGFAELGKLSELTELDLPVAAGVSDKALEALMPLAKLKKLDLRFCLVTDAGVKRLASLPSLELLIVRPEILEIGRVEAKAINPRLKVVDQPDASPDANSDKNEPPSRQEREASGR